MRAARSLLLFLAGAVILLPAASPRTLVAQKSCRALLRADATTPPAWLVADPKLAIERLWLPVFLPYLSDVVHDWDSTQAFWPIHEIDTTRFPLEGVSAYLLTEGDRQLAAVALVDVMRGEARRALLKYPCTSSSPALPRLSSPSRAGYCLATPS